MANLLATGNDWLASKLKAHASSAITYTRGASSVTIQATIGRHVPAALGTIEGGEVETFATVFTFDRVDLDFGSGPVVPDRGDVIAFTREGVTFTFDILPTDADRHWKEADAFGKRLEVNAKLAGRST